MGGEINIQPGGTITVNARARLNPDLDRLDRLELVVHGKVVATARAGAGAEEIRLTHRLKPDRGLWLAVRAYGKGVAVAHSAPVYVRVGDDPATFAAAEVPALVDKYKALLDATLAATPEPYEDLEHWDTGIELARQWQQQLPALRVQAARARARLEEIRAASSLPQ